MVLVDLPPQTASAVGPMLEQAPQRWALTVLTVGVAAPLLALLAAVPVA